MNGHIRGEMVLGLVLLERRQLTGRHAEDHAALHVPLDAHVVALREGVHLGSSAVDNHIDRRGTGRELIVQVGAHSRAVTCREGWGRHDDRHGSEHYRESGASKRWNQCHEKLLETRVRWLRYSPLAAPARREDPRSGAAECPTAAPIADTRSACSCITLVAEMACSKYKDHV